MSIDDTERQAELLAALDVYRPARQTLLTTLRRKASNRDPLAEFSEQFVHALLGGELAANPVQKGYDLVQVDGKKVHVRYLANPSSTWINEHPVRQMDDVELYALVLFEAFAVVGVLVFPLDTFAPICAALGKRHPRQEQELQFTRRNWRIIRDDPGRFRELGVLVWTPQVPQ